ncbi:MAG: hypothetical protein SFT90_03130 [Rickettsiales bacterium]|nr:hypothetical protein [Rickettsiales bacterium]
MDDIRYILAEKVKAHYLKDGKPNPKLGFYLFLEDFQPQQKEFVNQVIKSLVEEWDQKLNTKIDYLQRNAAYNHDIPGVIFALLANKLTNTRTQEVSFSNCFIGLLEGTSFLYEPEKLANSVRSGLSHEFLHSIIGDPKGNQHHDEYLADAFAVKIVGKENFLQALQVIRMEQQPESDSHPSGNDRIQAVISGKYEPAADLVIQKIKDGKPSNIMGCLSRYTATQLVREAGISV